MDFLKGIGGVVKSFDILGMAIDAGAQLLNLPPQVASVAKIGVGAFTGNVFTLVNGASDLFGQVAEQVASTQYAPSCKPGVAGKGYSAKGLSGQNGELRTHLETLKRHLGTLDTEGYSPLSAWALKDNKFNYYNLASAANDPNCPQELRDAARFFIGQPGLLLKLDTAAGIFPTDGVVGLADIEAMLDKVGPKTSPLIDVVCFSGPSLPDSKLSAYRDALTGLTRNWEAFDSCVASANGKIHQSDFAAIRDNPNASLEMKKVAKFFTENSEYFGRLEQAGQGSVKDLLASRSDVETELRRVNEEMSSSVGTVSSKSSAATSGDVRSLVSDPSLSIEEKISLILNNLLDNIDSNLESTVDELAAAQDKMGEKKEAAKDGKPYKGETQDARAVEKLNQKLQKLIEQKKAMSDLFSHMSAKFSEMSMTAISNIAKA